MPHKTEKLLLSYIDSFHSEAAGSYDTHPGSKHHRGFMLPGTPIESKRLFVAIDISGDVLSELIRVQSRIEEKIAPDGKLVSAGQIHLTLLFMPAVQDSLVPVLIRSIRSIAEQRPGIPMALSEVGTFPNSAAARILWVGVEAAHGRLIELQQAIADGLVSLGVESADSHFVPHITLVRAKRRTRMCLSSLPSKFFRIVRIPWVAQSVVLFQSIPTPAGHTHLEIGRFPLGPAGS